MFVKSSQRLVNRLSTLQRIGTFLKYMHPPRHIGKNEFREIYTYVDVYRNSIAYEICANFIQYKQPFAYVPTSIAPFRLCAKMRKEQYSERLIHQENSIQILGTTENCLPQLSQLDLGHTLKFLRFMTNFIVQFYLFHDFVYR